MSKSIYAGVDEFAHEIKRIYAGIDGIARKVKTGYVGVDDVARLFYVASAKIRYTGDYTVTDVEKDGVAYKLYSLLTSGILTLSTDSEIACWLCGGGGNGSYALVYYGDDGYSGCGGAGGYIATGTINQGQYAVVISSGAGESSSISKDGTEIIKALSGNNGTYEAGGDGSSGGGFGFHIRSGQFDGRNSQYGRGDTIPTTPFDIISLEQHCAGGAGGTAFSVWQNWEIYGSNGGSNGNNASVNNASTNAVGGNKGGGNGGKAISYNGQDASFYGSGGGGGYLYLYGPYDISFSKAYAGGYGYQGIVYLLVAA